MIFEKFSDYEKPWTYTDKYLFSSIKLTIFSFVNSAIVPLVSNIIQLDLLNNLLMVGFKRPSRAM